MVVLYLPAIVAIIGLVILLVAGNPKVARAGEIMFGAGLLVFLLGSKL